MQLRDEDTLRKDPKFQRLRELICKQAPETIQKLMACMSDMPELSPPSPKDGKRFLAERDKLSVTIDTALLDLVEETAADLGVPMSRVVESAVWQFYDKPPLSFQKSAEDDAQTTNRLVPESQE